MLPGQMVGIAKGFQCERCGKPATLGLCTESDSFGDEITSMCTSCAIEYQNAPPLKGECDFCKEIHKLSPLRSYDEGGRVYYVCDSCKERRIRNSLRW
jgi:hypothetical protein